ncbi:hypothetical protein IP98_01214 [Flavobacterium cauense R2A-7]|uniref:Subunit length determinant protein n=1 Tax=Flavobacterium cauense R2A-7 TaxID=1341154 RepID=A0A562M068_9FLAO|nr:hypothetical protein [Flavobacterium cauense]KGO81320.1 hypothetical protein Q762_08845 [Flavobacterium cauense R2A-7]TWI13232.1 hypothetical protein IP98_01214 [Flavobacterium cauense R2A-7]
MSNSPQSNPNDQEIDLTQLSKKIGGIIQSFVDWLFDGILFIRNNIVVIGVLFIIGAGLGFYLDIKTKVYDHEVIVTPNFGSTDYLYSKIFLIDSKIKEGDSIFLKKIGIKNPTKFTRIEIEPIIDVYGFINNSEQNFELLKLMAEDGDLKKIVKENMTSKNYKYHLISYTTRGKSEEESTLNPVLNFLNDSDFYKKIQKEYLNNIAVKIKENDSIIAQINGVMDQFSKTVNSNQKSDKLVYYNDNTQLNEVLKTKEGLINEKGAKRIELVTSDKIIKEISTTLNVENTKFSYGKKKFILPILLIVLFVLFTKLIRFYKEQLAKRNLA